MAADALKMQRPPPPLLPFLQFLLHRVRTDSLDLLQRVVSEFLSAPTSFTTVETVVQRGFPGAFITPIEIDDAEERERASAILEQMKKRSHEADRDAFRALHEALKTRIRLNHWDWLEQMYAEFCVGEETCLKAFVSLRQSAIGVLPVAPVAATVLVTPRPLRRGRPPSQRQNLIEPPTRKSRPTSSPVSAVAVKRRLPPEQDHAPRRRQQLGGELVNVYDALHTRMREVEMRKPWEQIFDVSKIEYPFDHEKHPKLSGLFKEFWTLHARAVWERNFWHRFFHNHRDKEDRLSRQDHASRNYERMVIRPAYEAFGAQFFVDLDTRPQRHHWWWYREPVVDMTRMSTKHGIEACFEYIEQNAFVRFPTAPEGMALRADRHQNESPSMWTTRAQYAHIRIEVLKLTEKAMQHRDKATETA